MKNLINKVKKSAFIRNIFLFIMPVSIAILLVMVYNLSQTVEHLSHSLIKRTTDKTQKELSNFFEPVINNLFTVKDWCVSESLCLSNKEKLNALFIPILKNSMQISSMLIADSIGNEYMLLKEETSWQNRITTNNNNVKKATRFRWTYNYLLQATLIKTWQQEGDLNYNPKTRPWYEDAKNTKLPFFTWTKPYIFKTTQDPGITTSVKIPALNPKTPYKILALDVKLTDISIFTTNLDISKNGKAFIINEDNQFIGLPADPRFINIDSLKTYVLKNIDNIAIDEVTCAINEWKKNYYKTEKPFQFESNGNKWWGGFNKFSLNNENCFYIGVIVPEKDFLEEVQRTQYIIIFGFLLVLILTLLVVRGYNQKRKAYALLAQKNEEITQQKEEIQAQRDEIEAQRDLVTQQKEHIEKIHKEVSQSIDYATKIQTAILPDANLLTQHFAEYFILFKPKDKVSGDFYWWAKLENQLVITVADCTGHGVPGAFMSMLGISFLREIVVKEYITNPAIILKRLRKEIIHALKQKGESGEQKDGMDMSLISINIETLDLQYSGANNPLYIIQNSHETEGLVFLQEFKSDKMPVAIHERMDNFVNQEFKLTKGDCIYLMSDGFQDQFGGPKGKKFMVKQLKEFFIANCEKPMNQQQKLLETTLSMWINTEEQIDDITILGIRV